MEGRGERLMVSFVHLCFVVGPLEVFCCFCCFCIKKRTNENNDALAFCRFSFFV